MMMILNIVLAHYVHIDLLSLGVGAGDEGGWGAGGGGAIYVRNPAQKPTCLTNNYLRPSGKRKGKCHD